MRREELPDAVEFAAREARRYLAGLDERDVRSDTVDESLAAFGGTLPEQGDGALAALAALAQD